MQDKPVALVTGANQGIGLQIAKDLATHGFTALIGSRNLENGETAAKGVTEEAHALQLDVTDQGSIAAAAEHIRSEFGRLDAGEGRASRFLVRLAEEFEITDEYIVRFSPLRHEHINLLGRYHFTLADNMRKGDRRVIRSNDTMWSCFRNAPIRQ